VSAQLSVSVRDAQNNPMDGYTATWRSSDPSEASVTSDGIVTALAQGAPAIIVTAAGITDSVPMGIAPPPPVGSRFVQVATKLDHACAISDGGQTYCWGNNAGGWVNPTSTQSLYLTPALVGGLPALTSLAFGESFTCGITAIGDLYCWGTIPTDSSGVKSPRAVVTGMNFTQVVAGSTHICGLTRSGDVYCWGDNKNGQLGTGTLTSTKAPTKVAGSFKFLALTADVDGTCGIATDSTAVCWGNAGLTGTSAATPTRKDQTRFTSLYAAQDGSAVCGTTSSGTSYCWGEEFVFPFGTPIAQNGAVGSIGANPPFTILEPGNAFACGLSQRYAYCWGTEDAGQNGLGIIQDSRSAVVAPSPVVWGMQYAQISVGVQSTCGVTVTGRVSCWGANSYGQLGDGDTNNAPSPVGNHAAGS
jgi:alpha-tubulin suppressor-like RCC1 family protein